MRTHNILIGCLTLMLGCLFSTTVVAEEAAPFVVVIDAGHGGKDPGAVGKMSQEKHLNLDVALMLGRMLEEVPGVKVCYTRKTDVFLTLQERANFVNKHNANLFICIHTNSAQSTVAKGAETFVLGIDDDKRAGNLDVAMRENAVMLLEDNFETTYQGFDPNSIDSYIMFELLQNQYIDQSLNYATMVQDQFTGALHLNDRGVRQAGFWVLHKSACPSVLVEMGFISNPEEERFLASEDGKQKIAGAMFRAFQSYKAQLDRRSGHAPAAAAPATPAAANRTDSTPGVPSTPSSPSVSSAPSTASPSNATSAPVFRVQIFSATRVLPAGDASFKGLRGCQYILDGKYYKYTYGEETDYQKIVALQNELRSKFADCFVVAFLDGKQIKVREALEMIQK